MIPAPFRQMGKCGVTLSESASVQPTMTRDMNKTGTSAPTQMHFAKTTETKGKSPKMIKMKKNKKQQTNKARKETTYQNESKKRMPAPQQT